MTEDSDKLRRNELGLGVSRMVRSSPAVCPDYALHSADFFSNLPRKVLQAFRSIATPTALPNRAVVFVEGQRPRGIYVLRSGKVKLSVGSGDGGLLILRIVGPGEVLGISATVSGRPHELTAVTLEPTRASFVQREHFLRFLLKHPIAGVHAAQQLSDSYDKACRQIRSLGLSHSAVERFVTLLLQLAARDMAHGGTGNRICVTLTHAEMAQMIGTSRETVTRLIAELKKQQLIAWNGSILQIRNKDALQRLAGSSLPPESRAAAESTS